MSKKENKILEEEAQARRDFLKKAGAIGATAPAVALLMSAKPHGRKLLDLKLHPIIASPTSA